MDIKAGNGFSRLANHVNELIESDPGTSRALRGMSVEVGLASDPNFAVPAHAAESAVFVGDEAWVDKDPMINAATEALLQTNPDKIRVRPRYDARRQRWAMEFKPVGDSLSVPPLMEGQMFSPWNISYLARVWQEPLMYSRAKQLVTVESGSNPWAEIFTLFLEQYAGWGMIGQTGSLQNNATGDVNIMSGMMSVPVINMSGTYTITLEEQERASTGSPTTGGKVKKELYLNYVLDMMDNILILYGNEETETKGLLDVNAILDWDTGSDMTTVSQGADPGSNAYKILAEKINDFLTSADNKFSHIQIAMSPRAYNLLTSMPYSDVYDPTAAMRIFSQNYLAGMGPNGTDPTIEFVVEPLLKEGTSLNPNGFDLMIMQAKSIPAGPSAQEQPTLIYAAPLQRFVYPVIPGMYNAQFKMLRRVAGVIAPIPGAIRCYAGFGIQE